jgi:hypothetical protein
MNITAIVTRRKPTADDAILFNARPDLQPPPELSFSICCGHCNRESAQAVTEKAALGHALGANWHLKIPSGFKLEGFFSLENLGLCEAICPRCFTAEFETE